MKDETNNNESIKIFDSDGSYTKINNAVFDVLSAKLSGNAFQCLMIIIRHTVGWQKDSCRMSYSKLKQFTKMKSHNTLKRSMDELEALGVIKVVSGGSLRTTNLYEINRDFSVGSDPNFDDLICNKVATSTMSENDNELCQNLTMSMSKNDIELCQKLTTYKESTKESTKERKEKKNSNIFSLVPPKKKNAQNNQPHTPIPIIGKTEIPSVPNIESPLAMILRRICKKPLFLTQNDKSKMYEALAVLEGNGATEVQALEVERKVHLSWISRDKYGRPQAPSILKVVEEWQAILDINENETPQQPQRRETKWERNERIIRETLMEQSNGTNSGSNSESNFANALGLRAGSAPD